MSIDTYIFLKNEDFPWQEFKELLDIFGAVKNEYKQDERFPYLLDSWFVPVFDSGIRIQLKKKHERLVWANEYNWVIALNMSSSLGNMWFAVVFIVYAMKFLPEPVITQDWQGSIKFNDVNQFLIWANSDFKNRKNGKNRKLRKLGIFDANWNIVIDPSLNIVEHEP